MADEILGHTTEEWQPMPPNMGPPLPRFLGIYWPWYEKEEVPGVFTCPYCGATFSTQEELNQHILTAHPEAPPVTYTCPYCSAVFSTQDELNYHIQTVHPTAPPPEEVPQIIAASWEPKWIESPYPGQLIKGKITISNPSAFSGKITVALPNNKIAQVNVITAAERQAKIAACEKARQEGYNHYNDLMITMLQALLEVDGCYIYIMEQDPADRLGSYVSKIGAGVDSKSWNVNFPAGESRFDFAFYIKADEGVRYNSGVYQLSPEVKLYDKQNNVLDDAIYENAIRFTIGEEWPVSVSIPAQIASGVDFQVSHTVHLTYGPDFEYRVELELQRANGKTEILTARYIGTNWYSKMQSFNPRADRYLLNKTGDYTFSGTKSLFRRTPGTYHLYSSCKLKEIESFVISPTGGSAAITYSVERVCWSDIDIGTVEVI